MGVEINRLTAPNAGSTLSNANGTAGSYRPVTNNDDDEDGRESPPPSSPTILRLHHNSLLSRSDREADAYDDDNDAAADDVEGSGETAGIYLGILNFYTSAPQFVGTLISMVVFAIVEPGKSRELAGDDVDPAAPRPQGVNAISVCMFIGGLSSLGAAYASWRLRFVR